MFLYILPIDMEWCRGIAMNKLFKYILENYNDGSEKVDSSI